MLFLCYSKSETWQAPHGSAAKKRRLVMTLDPGLIHQLHKLSDLTADNGLSGKNQFQFDSNGEHSTSLQPPPMTSKIVRCVSKTNASVRWHASNPGRLPQRSDHAGHHGSVSGIQAYAQTRRWMNGSERIVDHCVRQTDGNGTSNRSNVPQLDEIV